MYILMLIIIDCTLFNHECTIIEGKPRCVLDSNHIFKDCSNTDAIRTNENSEMRNTITTCGNCEGYLQRF